MEDRADAVGMAELTVRLGLVTEAVARESLAAVGGRTASAGDLVHHMERKGILTPLQGSKLLKGDRTGYFIGGYRILYKISSGTFGRVYRGDDPRTGRVVAIKVLRQKWTEEKHKVDLFMREGRVGLTLQHPNIVQILAVSQDAKSGQYYIVMEFIEGGNLRDILGIRKKLDIDESLVMMEGCADGLAYAWSRGLTHRDIKASNILVSTDKTSKLVDFGLAEITTSQAGSMELGRISEEDEDMAVDRTVDYTGLEKATNTPRGDVRSDIFFLGNILFEMITGDPLMPPTRDRQAKMQSRRYSQVENILDAKSSQHRLHPAIKSLVAKAVAFDPNQRYQSPNQFLEAIRRVREEVAGISQGNRRAAGPLTIFVVEQNMKLQDVFREKFKKMGFRVLITIDSSQALKRYQQSPFHALLVDAGTVGREGIHVYRQILQEADAMRYTMAGALILNEEQSVWESEMEGLPGSAVFIRPLTMKLLSNYIRGQFAELDKSGSEEEAGDPKATKSTPRSAPKSNPASSNPLASGSVPQEQIQPFEPRTPPPVG